MIVAVAAAIVVFLIADWVAVSNVQGVLLAIVNVYALILIVILLGTGLIALPRFCLRMAYPYEELKAMYFHAFEAEDGLEHAKLEMRTWRVSSKARAPRNGKKTRNLPRHRAPPLARWAARLSSSVFVIRFRHRLESRRRLKKSRARFLTFTARPRARACLSTSQNFPTSRPRPVATKVPWPCSTAA